LTPNELILTFRGSYVCADFGKNRSRNVTVKVLADGQTDTHTHTLTDANRFYNLSHAICYSYGTNQKIKSIHNITANITNELHITQITPSNQKWTQQ